ncbi:MAG: hypothetical protein Q8865_04985 [Bacillota bacterium]|nr:hypothetical protein [Bacillota bacterium]
MRRIIWFELKKMILRPISLAILILTLAINCLSIFTDRTGDFVSHDEIMALRAEQTKYAGKIDQNWTDEIEKKITAITENPKNLMSEDEKEAVRKEYMERGYTREYVDSLPNSAFLKPEIKSGLPYVVLEGAEYSSRFYSNVKALSTSLGEYYRAKYQGEKGEVLAQKAENMYGYLAEDYTAYYDCCLGWSKLIDMQRILPLTVGLFLLIALSSVFSGEYNQKTDSLLLSAKYGRSKLIGAKIAASFLLAAGVWLLILLINLILAGSVFGLEGTQTFVQDWQYNTCPFPYTELSNYLAVCGMSLTGIVIFTAVILFVSAKTRRPFITLLICGVVLLSPVIGNISQLGAFMSEILAFAPANTLIAANHFAFFKAYYVFGHAILMQATVPVVAVAVSGLLIPFACRAFERHQVEN